MPDAYSEWLDLPANLRPPTFYQLLGIAPSELDAKAISAAADRRLARLRTHEVGPRAEECRRIAGEVAQARDVLLDPVTRLNYDTLTPDAANAWWQPEPAALPAAAVAQVQGWWQGESPNPDRSESIGVSTPRPPDVPPVPDVAPLPTPLPVTAGTPAAPGQAKSADWWKGAAADADRDVPRPTPLPAPSPPAPSRPVPVRVPEAPPAAPLIRESALALTSPEPAGSPLRWLVLSLVAVGLAGVGVIYLNKSDGPTEPPDDKHFAEQTPRPDPTPDPSTLPVRPTPLPGKGWPDKIGPGPGVRIEGPEVIVPEPTPPVGPAKDPKLPPRSDETVGPVTFKGHTGGAYGVAVSRSGKTILSISDDRAVLHYSPREKDKHGLIHKFGSPGQAVAFCNEDREAVFCDGFETVVYDIAGGTVRATFENLRGGVRCLAPAPDGSFVLTGATDGCVRCWDTKTKALAYPPLDVDEKATVSALALSPDAQSAAVGLSDGRVATWDLKQRRQTKRWKAHTATVTAVAFAPDGRHLVSTGDDGAANVWQAGGQLVHKLVGHFGAVTGAVWSSDGRRVLTVGIDKTVRRWAEAGGWKEDWSATVPAKIYSVARDARDRFVVVGRSDGAVQLLPLPPGP